MRIGLDISVLNEPQKVGIGVYTYELIKHLLQINKTDQFILFGFSTMSTFEYLSNLEFKDYPNVQLKIIKLPAKLFRLFFLSWQKINWPKIEGLIGPVDLYHSFNWYLPPQHTGKKVACVFDLTSLIFPHLHQSKTTQLDRVRFERIARLADLVITISQSSRADFLSFYPKTNIEIIYPGVSDKFRQKINKQTIKKVMKKYNLAPGYILSVATLEPRKNLGNLLRAYLATDLNQPLVLAGQIGWKAEDILKLINQHQDRIRLLGFVKDEELRVLYQNALLFVYPSFYEGFGLPVLEAMAQGVPVISSNTSSLCEVGGDVAYYIDPKKPESIKKGLLDLVHNTKKRQKLANLGLKQAARFSWKKSAEKLNNLYQRICS